MNKINIQNIFDSKKRPYYVIISIITVWSFLFNTTRADVTVAGGRTTVSQLRALALAERTLPHNELGLDIKDTDRDEEWKRIVFEEGRWQEGVNYEALFAGRRVVFFGDTDHTCLYVQQGLVDHLEELKAAGVTHLGLEVPSNLPLDKIDEIAEERVRLPYLFKQLVKRARSLGIEPVFLDMPDEEQHAIPGGQRAFQRGIYIGKKAAEFLSLGANRNATMAVITGFGHIRDDRQIPQQLDAKGIHYGLVGAVGENQRGALWGKIQSDHPLLILSVAKAVARRAPPGRRYGYVNVEGLGLGIDGVVHFARRRLETPTARPTPALLGFQAATDTDLSLRGQSASLAEIREGQVRSPLHISFRPEQYSFRWTSSNQERIVQAIVQLQGITGGQKFYLAALLLSEAQRPAGINKTGSIIYIGFKPDGQFFEVITRNTHEYPEAEGADYSRDEQQWLLSLSTLQGQYGFPELISQDMTNFPPIEICNNPENPMSLIRIFPFILTAVRYPDRLGLYRTLGQPPRIRVYYHRTTPAAGAGFSTLTELGLDDFLLSDAEQALVDIENMMKRESSRCIAALTNRLRPRVDSEQDVTKQRAAEAAFHALFQIEDADYDFLYEWDLNPTSLILQARVRLHYLRQGEINRLLERVDRIIAAAEAAFVKMDELYAGYPDVAADPVLGGETQAAVLSDLKLLFQDLITIRENISAAAAPRLLDGIAESEAVSDI